MGSLASPLKASAIKTQSKILASIFVLLLFGFSLIFFQSFAFTKNALLDDYLNFFSQQATRLDESVGQVVNHVNMMKSIADTQLAARIDPVFLDQHLLQLREDSDYHESKNYHTYRFGEIINNKEIIATIVGGDRLSTQDESYAQFVALAVDLQAFQKAYQTINPNFVLSYYYSKNNTQAEFYPPLDMEDLVSKSANLREWMNVTGEVFEGKETPAQNPQGSLFWTDTYKDPVGNGMMVSCAVPVYDQGLYIGLLGSDVVLDFLNQHTERIKALPGIRAIISERENVISATGINYSHENEIIRIEEIIPAYRASLSDTIDRTTIHNEKGDFLFAITLKNAPWRYIFAVDQKVIFALTLKRVQGLALVTLLFLVMIPTLFILIYHRSIKPGIQAEEEILSLNKQLDLKVSQRTEALAEREAYSKALFEESTIPLVVMNPDDFTYTDCNKAALKIYGIKNKDEILGMTPLDVSAEVQPNGQRSSELAPAYISEALNKGAVTFEWKHQRPTGEQWDAEVHLMSIPHKNKILLHFSLIDITNRKNADKQRVKLEEQLSQSQKMDAIGQLAGGIAHDFNNMLGGILGAAELLNTTQENLDEDGKAYTEIIITSATRAAGLTAKLLAFSRKETATFTRIDLHSCLNEAVALLTNTIDKNIPISNTASADNSLIHGDISALQNVFINLGINAAQAMPTGGTLDFSTKNISLDESYCATSPFSIHPGPFILIEVHDTGIGIDPDCLKNIFEPFFTTKEQGKGTGLGLSAVYGTVQDHHGAITVYSELGIGSVFRIYLPTHSPSSSPAPIDPTHVMPQGSGNILFVDDEEILRRIGERILTNLGYTVWVASDGEEGLSIYKKRHQEIDLVITDMIMPIMNGRELFHQIKQVNADCKILLASGFTKEDDLKELNAAGLCGFIGKPYQGKELALIVDQILQS